MPYPLLDNRLGRFLQTAWKPSTGLTANVPTRELYEAVDNLPAVHRIANGMGTVRPANFFVNEWFLGPSREVGMHKSRFFSKALFLAGLDH